MKTIKNIIKISIFTLILILLTSCVSEMSYQDIFGVDTSVTIESKTVYNEKDIKITSKRLFEEVEKNGQFVQAKLFLQFDVENNSSDSIYIYSEYLCINDIMISSGCNEYFEAGTKGELNIEIFPSQKDGISVIKNIEFVLLIKNSDTDNEITKTNVITLSTSVDQDYVLPKFDDGALVYSGKEANIYLRMTEDNDLQLYMENKLNQTVNIMAYCTSVNNTPYEGFENNAHIVAGKQAFIYLSYLDSAINNNSTNKFGVNIVINDNTGKNLAFNKVIKDLGTIYVTVE